MRFSYSFSCIAVLTSLIAVAFAHESFSQARAGDAGGGNGQKLSYTITRDGSEIGRYDFTIEKNGPRRTVTARLDIDVTILGFSVYTVDHERREKWDGDRLVTLTAQSTYNDDSYAIRLEREEREDPQSYTLRVNDEARTLEGRVISLMTWEPGEWTRATRITPKGKAKAIRVVKQGMKELRINDQAIKAAHYKITGNNTRDMWYDSDGRLAKFSYTKDGALIAFTRQ